MFRRTFARKSFPLTFCRRRLSVCCSTVCGQGCRASLGRQSGCIWPQQDDFITGLRGWSFISFLVGGSLDHTLYAPFHLLKKKGSLTAKESFTASWRNHILSLSDAKLSVLCETQMCVLGERCKLGFLYALIRSQEGRGIFPTKVVRKFFTHLGGRKGDRGLSSQHHFNHYLSLCVFLTHIKW